MRSTTFSQPEFVYRQATLKGDLVIIWKGSMLELNTTLATEKELAFLKQWLQDETSLQQTTVPYRTTCSGTPENIRAALGRLISKQVGETGYVVYAIGKRGKGRVILKKEVDTLVLGDEQTKEVVKVKQAVAG